MKREILKIDLGAKIFGIADASAIHVIDQKDQFELLKIKGEIIQVPSGEDADYYMISYAENKINCVIITNDNFRQYNVSGDLRSRIIPVIIIDEVVIFSKKLNDVSKMFMNIKKITIEG